MHKPIVYLAAAVVSLCTLWASAGDDDAAVGALLERMESAVLAGDTGAYLACVDTTVPEWATEQSNWAADLADHRPEEFALTLRSPLEAEGADASTRPGVLRARLEFAWSFSADLEQTVEFPVLFTRTGEGDWRYAGEAWTRLESDDGQTVVLFLSDRLGEVATRITGIMPGIREHVDTGFETHLEHPQVIKLYSDMLHLQQSIYLSYSEPLGGWNEPGEAIKIMAARGTSTGQLRHLLAHEYGHVATFTYDENAAKNLPWWVAEGVAELAAEAYEGKSAREAMGGAVRAWAATDSLAAWGDMRDFRTTPPRLHGHVYLQGHHFLGYVSEEFGRTARNAWVRDLASGRSLDEASEDAFGRSFEEIEASWRESLR